MQFVYFSICLFNLNFSVSFFFNYLAVSTDSFIISIWYQATVIYFIWFTFETHLTSNIISTFFYLYLTVKNVFYLLFTYNFDCIYKQSYTYDIRKCNRYMWITKKNLLLKIFFDIFSFFFCLISQGIYELLYIRNHKLYRNRTFFIYLCKIISVGL